MRDHGYAVHAALAAARSRTRYTVCRDTSNELRQLNDGVPAGGAQLEQVRLPVGDSFGPGP